MTSSNFSDPNACKKCGTPLRERQKHPFPIALQIVFAVSFILFLGFYDRLHSPWQWTWTTLQVFLGILLIRARIRSRHKILVCIRCGANVG